MGYCTYSDVETRIGAADLTALADYDGDGLPDADVVAAAIDDASALIDSYLSVRFAVPVSPVPDALQTRAVNLAVYFLRLGRDSATEDVRSQYEEDLAWLREVVKGEALAGLDPSPAAAEGASGVLYQGQRRIFGRNEPL